MTSKELADELGISQQRVYNAYKGNHIQGMVIQEGSHKMLRITENENLKTYKHRVKNNIPIMRVKSASDYVITLHNGVEYYGLIGMECALGN